jgi:hypothetical protein
MSKRANAGELRTSVNFTSITRTTDADGFPVEVETNVFGTGKSVNVKWVNAHGNEVFEYMTLKLREPATLTMRYSPLITPRLKVYRAGDTNPYEIISIDNVEQRNEWLEIKVQRSEAAR